ncbi:MAG: hypothetical protein ABIH99_05575 [Candidatus Micrarchaeota archaeon]
MLKSKDESQQTFSTFKTGQVREKLLQLASSWISDAQLTLKGNLQENPSIYFKRSQLARIHSNLSSFESMLNTIKKADSNIAKEVELNFLQLSKNKEFKNLAKEYAQYNQALLNHDKTILLEIELIIAQRPSEERLAWLQFLKQPEVAEQLKQINHPQISSLIDAINEGNDKKAQNILYNIGDRCRQDRKFRESWRVYLTSEVDSSRSDAKEFEKNRKEVFEFIGLELGTPNLFTPDAWFSAKGWKGWNVFNPVWAMLKGVGKDYLNYLETRPLLAENKEHPHMRSELDPRGPIAFFYTLIYGGKFGLKLAVNLLNIPNVVSELTTIPSYKRWAKSWEEAPLVPTRENLKHSSLLLEEFRLDGVLFVSIAGKTVKPGLAATKHVVRNLQSEAGRAALKTALIRDWEAVNSVMRSSVTRSSAFIKKGATAFKTGINDVMKTRSEWRAARAEMIVAKQTGASAEQLAKLTSKAARAHQNYLAQLKHPFTTEAILELEITAPEVANQAVRATIDETRAAWKSLSKAELTTAKDAALASKGANTGKYLLIEDQRVATLSELSALEESYKSARLVSKSKDLLKQIKQTKGKLKNIDEALIKTQEALIRTELGKLTITEKVQFAIEKTLTSSKRLMEEVKTLTESCRNLSRKVLDMEAQLSEKGLPSASKIAIEGELKIAREQFLQNSMRLIYLREGISNVVSTVWQSRAAGTIKTIAVTQPIREALIVGETLNLLESIPRVPLVPGRIKPVGQLKTNSKLEDMQPILIQSNAESSVDSTTVQAEQAVESFINYSLKNANDEQKKDARSILKNPELDPQKVIDFLKSLSASTDGSTYVYPIDIIPALLENIEVQLPTLKKEQKSE